jgi:predicted secreted protein
MTGQTPTDSARVQMLAERLSDQRGKRVVFLSHCLLNENTRYLGGACRAGCVPEVLDACVELGLGIVQMPCPEELAWGGVLKRRLLLLYDSRSVERPWLRRMLVPIAVGYTRWRYQRQADAVTRQIADYRRSGYAVVAVVGVDGSPSCGLARSMDIQRAVQGLAAADPATITTSQANAIVLDCLAPGPGLFLGALQDRLARRNITATFVAHDLRAELAGEPSEVPDALRRAADSP